MNFYFKSKKKIVIDSFGNNYLYVLFHKIIILDQKKKKQIKPKSNVM